MHHPLPSVNTSTDLAKCGRNRRSGVRQMPICCIKYCRLAREDIEGGFGKGDQGDGLVPAVEESLGDAAQPSSGPPRRRGIRRIELGGAGRDLDGESIRAGQVARRSHAGAGRRRWARERFRSLPARPLWPRGTRALRSGPSAARRRGRPAPRTRSAGRLARALSGAPDSSGRWPPGVGRTSTSMRRMPRSRHQRL